MLPGGGLRQPASQPSSALSTRIAAKKAELENLRQLRDLSGTLAMQMQALESKIATLKDGTEGPFAISCPSSQSQIEGTQTDSNQRLHACLPIGTMCFAPSVWPPVSLREPPIPYRTGAISTNATGHSQSQWTSRYWARRDGGPRARSSLASHLGSHPGGATGKNWRVKQATTASSNHRHGPLIY